MSKLSIGVSKHDHLQGNLNAVCSLVEYGDYECPSCGDVQPTIRSLQAHTKILVIGADVMSSILDYTDRATCILFGMALGRYCWSHALRVKSV